MAWQSLFWSAFERSRNGMALVDGGRRPVEANAALCELLAYDRDRLLELRLEELFPAEERSAALMRWDQHVERGDPFTAERELLRGDGSRVRIEFAAQTEAVTGRLLALFVVLHHDAAEHAEHPDAPAVDPLTPREREIVHLLTLGRTGPEIAAELIVSPETVRTHVRNAMEKTGSHTRAQLVAYALAQGVIAAE